MQRYLLVMIGSLLLCGILLVSCGGDATQTPDTSSLYAISHYGKTFSDMNPVHFEAAQRLGIEPIGSREEAEKLGRKLKEISSNKYYQLDKLTHSIPFLVPKAKDLLETIGKNFLDSLEKKHISPYRVIVTSVLRTEGDITRLRKKNSNSSDNSAHQYGTTFDISYVRFQKVVETGWFAKKEPEDVETALLKSVLAQVLKDLREAEQCYVRYEVRQGCFHITVR